MPPLRSRTALSLALSVVLPGGTALAQSSWVDPPARPAASAKAVPDAAKAPPDATRAASDAAKSGAVRPRQGASPETARAAAAPSAPRAPAETRTVEAERHRNRAPARRVERHRPAPAPDRLAEAPPPVARSGDWAGTAQGLAADYFDAISAPGVTMISATPRFYGDQIRFYGRTMSLSALLAEKRRFAQRWPERRYAPRGMHTLCNGALATCTVRAQVAFRTVSPGRGAVSQGVAEVVLEVSLAGPRPAIVSESGRVLSRGGNFSALSQPAGGA